MLAYATARQPGLPGAVYVVTPDLAVVVGPADHNPRGLHNAGIRRRYDDEGKQQRGEGERYVLIENLPCS